MLRTEITTTVADYSNTPIYPPKTSIPSTLDISKNVISRQDIDNLQNKLIP
jgi:hypothetical protein